MPVSVSSLPRCTPEAAGVASSSVAAFLDAIQAKGLELHSLMLLRNGRVFAEGWWSPFSADRKHMLYSLSKSFTSTAIGMLVDEGRLSIDAPVVSFFPEETPADASENLRAMRVRDLLTMTAGHAADDMADMFGRADGDWPRGFLGRPVPYVPGTHFVYNTGATYMCSAILTRITGETLFTYLTPRLFEPLGIEGAHWTTDPKGITYGGSGLSVRTEDIAKFGQLYLQRGRWEGRQLVSEAWVEQATSRQVSNGAEPDNDWHQGYGFQFWRCVPNCYRGDGAFGQNCIVIEETGMVVVTTSSVDDLGAILRAVWDHLRNAPQDEPLPENTAAAQALSERLGSLEVAGPVGEKTSPIAGQISGRAFLNDREQWIYRSTTFDFRSDGGALVTMEREGGDRIVGVGGDHWDVHPAPSGKIVATRGTWTAPDVYTVAMRSLDGPEARRIECRFDGNRVSVRETKRGYFGPAEGYSFDGTLAT